MSIVAKRRYAATAFVTLLLLSVFWPSPVVSSNRLWLNQPLAVDDLSFLGREAPSWDVVFWFFAGLLLIAMLHSAESYDWRVLRFERPPLPGAALLLAGGALVTAIVWRVLDAPGMAWAEGIQSDWTEWSIRMLNRLGGGMNPGLIVLFFLVAGVCYRSRSWVAYAVAMGISGLTAGILAQIVKHIIGRARPELWLGPAHYAPGSSTSFPSGHTVGAFALAGVLMLMSRNWPLRIIALTLAIAIALSRVLAFRHWPSDVCASSFVGVTSAWIASRIVIPLTQGSADAP